MAAGSAQGSKGDRGVPSRGRSKMIKKLLPCPFCGGEPGIFGNEGNFYVACKNPNCYCSLGEVYDVDGFDEHIFKTKESASDAWNNRFALP